MNQTGPGPASTWEDLLSALEFVVKRFEKWTEERRLRQVQTEAIVACYRQQKEAWRQAQQRGESPPVIVELPSGTTKAPPAIRVYCFWKFLYGELQKHHQAERLTLPQYHALTQEAEERLAALERRIRHEGLELPAFAAAQKSSSPDIFGKVLEEIMELPTLAPPSAAPPPPPRQPPAPRRSLLEIFLDPRSIQWLLGTGGALFVIGLVILLWVNEILTPPRMAITMGIANAAVLLGGWAMILRTKYRFTGKAITLLACFVMPLNLWYYHAQGLITVADHLWLPALVISGLYAVSAYVLKDELFVYILMGGVTMTGLLMLAAIEPSPQYFWEIASPTTFLVVLGLIAIHVERVFVPEGGAFSRAKFGLAFFRSGHALLAAGLLILLGAQVAGDWLYEPFFKELYVRWKAQPSPIVQELSLQILALALVLVSTYAYVYSDLVVRKTGLFVYVAALTLLWALLLIVRLLRLELDISILIIALSLLAVIMNVVQATTLGKLEAMRALPVHGALLSAVAIVMGLHVYLRSLLPNLREVAFDQPWWTVLAMLVAALSCRLSAYLYRQTWPQLSWYYFFATAAATLVGSVALLAGLGLTLWEQSAPLLMVIPIAYIVTARFYRGKAAEQPVLWCAHLATLVMIISSLACTFESLERLLTMNKEQESLRLNLTLSLFFAEAMVFYVLSAVFFQHRADIHLATAMACAALWQLLTWFQVTAEYYTLAFALVGMGLLVAYRFSLVEKMAKTLFISGNTLLTVSLGAAIFIGLSRIATQHVQWLFVGLCVTLGVLSLLAMVAVQHAGWQRWYLVSAIAQALLTFLAFNVLSELSAWQKLEIFSVAAGLVLLLAAHLGWYREQERHSDLVTLSLYLGSILAALPIAIATIYYRLNVSYHDTPPQLIVFLWLNEVGFLTLSVLLLITGILFRLQSTTLVGGFHVALYFLTLPILIEWRELNVVAILITVGGGLLFAVGLLLSVYRERLLALPEKIKNRQGIFKVMTWR